MCGMVQKARYLQQKQRVKPNKNIVLHYLYSTLSPDFGSKCDTVLVPAATHRIPVSGINPIPVTVSLITEKNNKKIIKIQL